MPRRLFSIPTCGLGVSPETIEVLRRGRHQVRLSGHGLAPRRVRGHDAGPHAPAHLRVLEVVAVLARRARADLGARRVDLDPQDPRGLLLRRAGVPRRRPPPRHQVVRDALHGPEPFGLVVHDARAPEHARRPVVAAVVVRRQREHDAVEERRSHAHPHPRVIVASGSGGSGIAAPRRSHHARRHVPVQVDEAGAVWFPVRVFEVAREPHHREDDGIRLRVVLPILCIGHKGDMNDRRVIDYVVDCFVVVDACTFSQLMAPLSFLMIVAVLQNGCRWCEGDLPRFRYRTTVLVDVFT